MKVHELGEGGRTEATIAVDPVKLWIKADGNAVCPSSLSFSVMLPTTFQEDGRSYVGLFHQLWPRPFFNCFFLSRSLPHILKECPDSTPILT